MESERERWQIGKVEFETRPFCLKIGKRKKRLGENEGRLLLFLVYNFRNYPAHTNDQVKGYVWNQRRDDSSLYHAAHLLEKALGGKKGDYIATRPYHLVVRPKLITATGTPCFEEPTGCGSVTIDKESSEPLTRADSLQERGRPLAAESLLNATLKTSTTVRTAQFIEKLRIIREHNISDFFRPNNRLCTTIVWDRSYRSPTPGTKISTTDDWAFAVRKVFDELSRVYGVKSEPRGANYDEPTIHDLVKEERNLISYASSKINPCTDDMIEELNRRLGLNLRFVYESDARLKTRSVFTFARRGERAALMFDRKIFKYQETKSSGRDHGILLRYRFPEKHRRQWIIFAGCSRPGSVAAGKLVFDREFGEALWSRPDLHEPLRSFLCVFETSFIPPHTDKPQSVRILHLLQFP